MSESNPRALSWDQRYSSETYVYGKEANAFFSAQLEAMNPGRLLLPGEGEGRNAVHAAGLGWEVEAFDQSRMGLSKALALASEYNVRFSYRVCRMEDFDFSQDRYDLVALLFFHAHADKRSELHRKAVRSLKPGGKLILEAFHKEQINNDTGGPRSALMLYDEEALAADFNRLETTMLEKGRIILNEGPFHQGAAEIIRYTGIKIN
jgi:SAM-dependent methyltransferase